MSNKIPIINISALINDTELKSEVCQQINKALREFGFFYIIGHGISESLLQQIDSLSRQFFAQPLEEKLKVRKTLDSWRGYFGVDETKISGNINRVEGINFGTINQNEIQSKQQTSLYPKIPGFEEIMENYINNMTALGHKLIEGIALSLNLDKHYFAERYTGHEPVIMTKFLNYPPVSYHNEMNRLGIGEHSDYGFLTILKQDNTGGLQIKCKNEWIDATPVENSFICNIGDGLQLVTGGLYRSTLHRVKSPTQCNRISIPFFFSPNIKSRIKRIEGFEDLFNGNKNDDQLNEDAFNGTYGDYMAMKISKVYVKN